MPSSDPVPVKVSAASCRQRFHGCEPSFIRDVCHGRCCDAPTRPTGTLITIHPSEEQRIVSRGVCVTDGLLQPRPGERVCPFKTEDHLCGLHYTPDKPFGCIASPFTLNRSGTLIVRNRYRLLPCYNVGPRLPAYKAFRASLALIFGRDLARSLSDHLDAGGGDIVLPVAPSIVERLRTNDAIKHAATHRTGPGAEDATGAG